MAQDLATMPPEKGYKALVMIWGAMVFSVAVYAVIARMMPVRWVSIKNGQVLGIALGTVSAGLFLAQFKLHRNLRDDRLFARILDLGSWGLRSEAAQRLQELKVPERGVQLILQAHIIFGIVIWAMAEAVAIFGLFLTLLAGNPRYMAAFGAVSLAQLLWFRPRQAAFKEQVTRWHRYVETNRGKWGTPDTETR